MGLDTEVCVLQQKENSFNPLETRKRIMIHTHKKIEVLKQKQAKREHDLSNYAKEEHQKHLLHKEEAHQKSMLHKEEAHQKVMQKWKKGTINICSSKKSCIKLRWNARRNN